MNLLNKVVLAFVLLVMQVAATNAATKVTYFHTNAQGSVIAATDEQGGLLWQEGYEPYGKRLLNETTDEKMSYAGHSDDKASSLVYMGARYYDPTVGRFMSVDPAGVDPANTFSINRYAYANNNPYGFVDPDGRNAVTALGGLLQETTNFATGDEYDYGNVWRALKDGYNGEGSGFAQAATEDALSFIPAGAVAGGAVKLYRIAQASSVAKSTLVVAKGGASFAEIKTVLTSAQEAYKGSTVVGHALSKHAGRHPEIWGKMSGSMKTWNDQAMTHLRDIARGPGDFRKVTKNGISFLEKRLEDGRGMRLNMDGTFKTFIE